MKIISFNKIMKYFGKLWKITEHCGKLRKIVHKLEGNLSLWWLNFS